MKATKLSSYNQTFENKNILSHHRFLENCEELCSRFLLENHISAAFSAQSGKQIIKNNNNKLNIFEKCYKMCAYI